MVKKGKELNKAKEKRDRSCNPADKHKKEKRYPSLLIKRHFVEHLVGAQWRSRFEFLYFLLPTRYETFLFSPPTGHSWVWSAIKRQLFPPANFLTRSHDVVFSHSSWTPTLHLQSMMYMFILLAGTRFWCGTSTARWLTGVGEKNCELDGDRHVFSSLSPNSLLTYLRVIFGCTYFCAAWSNHAIKNSQVFKKSK